MGFRSHNGRPARWLGEVYQPDYGQPLTLDVVVHSPHTEAADEGGAPITGSLKRELAQLLSQSFTVSPMANRMAYRLAGAPISTLPRTTVSQATAFGAIQLPPSGEPIVLLKDRQTMGGYPLLGCVTRLSAFRLGQARPGTKVQFRAVSLAKAQQQLARFYREFELTEGL